MATLDPFETLDQDIDRWRRIGVKPYAIPDRQFRRFAIEVGSTLDRWLTELRGRPTTFDKLARRLNDMALVAYPGHLWNQDTVREMLFIYREMMGMPVPRQLAEGEKMPRQRLRRRSPIVVARMKADLERWKKETGLGPILDRWKQENAHLVKPKKKDE